MSACFYHRIVVGYILLMARILIALLVERVVVVDLVRIGPCPSWGGAGSLVAGPSFALLDVDGVLEA